MLNSWPWVDLSCFPGGFFVLYFVEHFLSFRDADSYVECRGKGWMPSQVNPFRSHCSLCQFKFTEKQIPRWNLTCKKLIGRLNNCEGLRQEETGRGGKNLSSLVKGEEEEKRRDGKASDCSRALRKSHLARSVRIPKDCPSENQSGLAMMPSLISVIGGKSLGRVWPW